MENMGGSLFVIISFLCFTYTIAYENVKRFHSADRQTIVQTHNNLRRSIYNAANMRELTWNHAVAHAAAEWAQKCEYISRPDNQWGQNMNYFYGREADRDPIDLFRESFKGWSDDSERVQYDYRRYRYCGRKHVCSYVQLIAADVQEVGCALVTCPRLQLREPEEIKKNAKLLVCFYTPWVNIVGNEVFIPQKRCDACPAGTRCVDNLCSARSVTSSPGIPRLQSLGEPAIQIADKSGSRDTVLSHRSDHSSGKQKHRSSNRRQKPSINNSYSEHRGNPDTYARQTDSNSPTVIYTPNNRVIPFPGREESRDIRRITRLEKRRHRQNQRRKQAELVDTPITVAEGPDKEVTFSVTNKTGNISSRSELTGEEQFFIISAHNLLRQEVGAKALAWNSRLERWAKYVIRCDVEYPGPITAYTNFGKAEAGQDIYNVVYNWGAEGNDVNRSLRYGCRTPYDKSRCNHNTIIITQELTQMACAALNCRSRRQLTCVYNDA